MPLDAFGFLGGLFEARFYQPFATTLAQQRTCFWFKLRSSGGRDDGRGYFVKAPILLLKPA
jgi:hypothetical protein